MLIRPETPADIAVIFALTTQAFAAMAFSDGTDPTMVNALRDADDLTLPLITEDAGQIGGHNNNWYGLGPIFGAPDRQKQGIGSTMVAEGINRPRNFAAIGIALIANPKVYGLICFKSEGLTYRDLPSDLVQSLPLSGQTPQGVLTFAPALEA